MKTLDFTNIVSIEYLGLTPCSCAEKTAYADYEVALYDPEGNSIITTQHTLQLYLDCIHAHRLRNDKRGPAYRQCGDIRA